jgi:hypothetical protein
MPVTTAPIKSWSTRPLKFKPNTYPTCDDGGAAPKFYWVGLFVGARQSGKTYSLVQLLKHYEDCGVRDPNGALMDQRIILFSPTVDANPVWGALKNLDPADIHDTFSDDLLQDVVADIKAEKEASDEYKRAMALWHKFMRARSVDDLTDDELMEIESWGFGPPPRPRFPNGAVNFVILDDLVGTQALRPGRSALTYTAIRNRHLQINLAVLVQGMRQVPKIIRNNANLFAIWKFANRKMMAEDLYEEVSSVVTLPQFEELFAHCTEEPHQCMVLDFSQPRGQVIRKSFKEVVKLAP